MNTKEAQPFTYFRKMASPVRAMTDRLAGPPCGLDVSKFKIKSQYVNGRHVWSAPNLEQQDCVYSDGRTIEQVMASERKRLLQDAGEVTSLYRIRALEKQVEQLSLTVNKHEAQRARNRRRGNNRKRANKLKKEWSKMKEERDQSQAHFTLKDFIPEPLELKRETTQHFPPLDQLKTKTQ